MIHTFKKFVSYNYNLVNAVGVQAVNNVKVYILILVKIRL